MSKNSPDHKISVTTATSMVISNMIGTGIFTSLGFQLMGIHSVSAIAALWVVGGISAMCGALCYGELAARFPRSGGEYNFLSRIYDPALGFLSGYISATIGFAVPIAISALAFNKYLQTFTGQPAGPWLPIVLVLCIVTVNLRGIKVGGLFQKIITGLTLTLIVGLIGSGIVLGKGVNFQLSFTANDWEAIFSSPFAVSLVYVAYAYTGWNSAAYIAGEIKNPAKNLPIALVAGTAIVTVLYVLLNLIFLYITPMEQLAGQLEIGFITASSLFGELGGEIVSIVICIALIGSIFSMTITGPRVSQTVGEDFPFFKILSRKNKMGAPYIGLMIQAFITIILILTNAFESIMLYIGFTLSLITSLTVLGLFVVRLTDKKEHSGYKTIGYPITPILFLLAEGWMVVFTFKERPYESLIGLVTVLSGFILYYLAKKLSPKHA